MALWTPLNIFSLSIILRLVLLFYGLYQDTHSAVKYTDIDYLVFTDAARYVSQGVSPYTRETYRYTPLLAWALLPTAFSGPGCFEFGKVLFAMGDLGAGWLLYRILCSKPGGSLSNERALKFASVWLLNPMVATISTRGSSEGLLGLLVVALLWAALYRQPAMAGFLLGLGVHVKIYPFIYAPSLLLYFETRGAAPAAVSITAKAERFFNRDRIGLTVVSATTFSLLNAAMYALYGPPFLQHTFLHHLTRIDHRHNFSPYNTLLYLSSAQTGPSSPSLTSSSSSAGLGLGIESLAFLPQLSLSAFLIPLFLAKKSLPTTMLAQTMAFVAQNKVCTSQYFLWYLVLLPLYLPRSRWLQPRPSQTQPQVQSPQPKNPQPPKQTQSRSLTSQALSFLRAYGPGLRVLGLWVLAQAAWLQQGYELEFVGRSTFVPGLWAAGLGFYAVNMWILGVVVGDAAGL